jgi:hypothetical protein
MRMIWDMLSSQNKSFTTTTWVFWTRIIKTSMTAAVAMISFGFMVVLPR